MVARRTFIEGRTVPPESVPAWQRHSREVTSLCHLTFYSGRVLCQTAPKVGKWQGTPQWLTSFDEGRRRRWLRVKRHVVRVPSVAEPLTTHQITPSPSPLP